jgi:WD40 repeat protein
VNEPSASRTPGTSGTGVPLPPSRRACLPAAALEALGAGAAEPPSEAAEGHLRECARCRATLARVRADNLFLASVREDLGGSPSRSEAAGESPGSGPGAEAGPGPVNDGGMIPGYRILGELDRGGQGVVYRAVQLATRRHVALKLPLHGLLSTKRERWRFEREIEIVAGLRHPCVVTVYDSGVTADGRCFVAMELVDGVTLDTYARSERVPSAGEPLARARHFLDLMARVAGGVQHAHARGVMHRDLKPQNILVDGAGEPRVMDFGIARLLTGPGGSGAGAMATRTQEFMGTLAYASPEQVSGVGGPDGIDVRTDVYSLGVILYELLSGRRPYPADGAIASAVQNILHAAPGSLSGAAAGVDDEIDTIVLRALSKDPAHRYVSAGALEQDLRRYLGGEPIDAKRDSRVYVMRKFARRHRLAVLAVGAVFAITAGSAVALGRLAWRLDRQRTWLQAALAEATVGRGRLLSSAGSVIEAERQLHSELSLSEPAADLGSAAFHGPRATRAPLWALAEISARQPCVAAVRLPITLENGNGVGLRAGADSVVLTRRNGDCWRLTLPALEAIGRGVLETGGSCLAAPVVSGDLATAWAFSHGEILVADVVTGRMVAHAPWPGGSPPRAIVPDSRGVRAVATDADGVVWIWEPMRRGASEPRILDTVRTNFPSEAVCFDPRGKGVFVIDASGAVRCVDTETGSASGTVQLPADVHADLERTLKAHRSTGMAASERGARLCLLIGPSGYSLDLNEPAGPWVHLPPHRTGDTAIDLDASGRIGVTRCNFDSIVRVVDIASGASIREIQTPQDYGSVAVTPDGTLVVTVDGSGLVRVWRAVDDPWRRTLRHGAEATDSVAFSPDGCALLTGLADGRVLAWSTRETDRPPRVVARHGGVVAGLAFTADRSRVATLGYDGFLKLVPATSEGSDADGAAPLEGVETIVRTLSQIAVDPRGRFIACAGRSPNVAIYSQVTGEALEVLQTGGTRVPSIAFSPDGRWLAWARENQIIVRDMDSGTIRAELAGHERVVRVVCFSHDGSLLASGGEDQSVRLWSTRDWAPVRELSAARESIYTLAFHPAGLVLAGGGRSGTVRFWEVGDGRELAAIGSHAGLILGLAFAPSGGQLAVAGGNAQAAELWDLEGLMALVDASRPVFSRTQRTGPGPRLGGPE